MGLVMGGCLSQFFSSLPKCGTPYVYYRKNEIKKPLTISSDIGAIYFSGL